MSLTRSMQFGYFWHRWKWLIVAAAAVATIYILAR